MTLNQRDVLQGRYRVVKKLGEGGFGAVYQAWDINLECHRAVKENLDISPQAQRQFKIEAKILNQISHPNLPRVIDHFIIEGQGQYLVMDYVEGQDLGEMLENGPLPEQRVLPWIIQVCDALSYLHAQNPPVIHRDIKPANIKITPHGKAMLVDFGISKIYDPTLSTTMGARAVTPGYSPPEQYGQGSTDARSDLYSLGATLYHLLTGKKPPDSVDIMTHSCPPPPPVVNLNPSISSHIGDAIQHAMALDREARWHNADAFKKAITTQTSGGKQPLDVNTTQVVTPQKPYDTNSSMAGNKLPDKSRSFSMWILAGIGVLFILISIFFAEQKMGGLGVVDTPVTLIRTETSISPSQTPMNTVPTHTIVTRVQGDTFVDDFGVEMAWIPAGSFMMGSEDGDDDEQPIHEVYLDTYAIDIYEVTNALFAEFLNEVDSQGEDTQKWLIVHAGYTHFWRSDGIWRVDSGYENHPIVYVNWHGAYAYCEWRNARLPTEAEWEKSSRGGLIGMEYPWNNKLPSCDKNSLNGVNFNDCSYGTFPVGSFFSNKYGLFDMAGNVREWVFDWYRNNYYEFTDYQNPLGPNYGEFRVLRGGSFFRNVDLLRVYNRDKTEPNNWEWDIGFRCAKSQ